MFDLNPNVCSSRRPCLQSSCGCPVSWRCSGSSSPSPLRTLSCRGSTNSLSARISSPATQSVACISRAFPRVTHLLPTRSSTRNLLVRHKGPHPRTPLPGERSFSLFLFHALRCFHLSVSTHLLTSPFPSTKVPSPASRSVAG